MMLRFVVLAIALTAVLGWEKKPDFCRDDDCPQYTVIAKTEDYEVREYAAAKWVCTNYKATNVWARFWQMNYAFMRLFKFIDGNNDAEEKIPMTRPVMTMVFSDDDADYTHKMCFYVSPDHAENLPQPLDSKVSSMDMPAAKFYVKSFSGMTMGQGAFEDEVTELMGDLASAGSYVDNYWGMAGYNSPMEWSDRHNEVFLQVIEE